jgi:hypothetical protein
MHSDFEILRRTLPDEARDELDAILKEVRDRGIYVDEMAIASAIRKTRIAAALDKVPPLPRDLERVASQDGGRLYELTLDVNPTDPDAVLAAYSLFRAECTAVSALVGEGFSIDAAWGRLRADLAVDPPAKTVDPPSRYG